MSQIKTLKGDVDGVYIVDPDSGDAISPSENIATKLHEAFENYAPNTGGVWAETKASGDIIRVDGNANGASYLVISKDPLSTGTSSSIETISRFNIPVDASIGLSISQRTLGQEFSVEVVSDDQIAAPSDIAISSISQSGSTLTVNTAVPHGLTPGMSIGIYGVSNSQLNYPSITVATIPSPNQFTVTAGPGGNLQSVNAGPFTEGFVFFRSLLGYAQDGVSIIFNNTQITNMSCYVRRSSGDAIVSGTVTGNHSVGSASTSSVQAINAPYTYAFTPTSEYRLNIVQDRVTVYDSPVDQAANQSLRYIRSQVVPGPDKLYKLRIRAVNNKSFTTPTAQIVSATKTGTTTATIVFDRPHGLTTADQITIFGTRDQTNFPNITTATAVGGVVNATSITLVWGPAVTATSYGGFISRCNGGVVITSNGTANVACSTATLSGGVLTLVGNTSWGATYLIGDYVNVVGLRNNTDGATLGVDGAYRVRNNNASTLELERIDGVAMPADFASTNCGGAVIKRTDIRISFARVFQYERERVELINRASSNDNSIPVVVSTTITAAAIQNGQTAHDSPISGSPFRVAGRAVTSNYTAVSSGDVADLITTTVGAQIAKPYSIPELDWAYAAAAGGITNTTDVIARAAGAAGIRNYVTGISLSNANATATEFVIKDGASTVLWRCQLPANTPNFHVAFPSPLKGTAATALNIACVTTGAQVYANLQGFQAP